MSNAIFNDLAKKAGENLPAILTSIGVAVDLATVGYSIYAGWKIKETVDDDELTKKQKVLRIIRYSIPSVGGAAVAVSCHVAAYKKAIGKLAGAAAIYGAAKVDTQKLKDETTKILGGDSRESSPRHEDDRVPSVSQNQTVTIRDTITGYVFETTMEDFWDTVSRVNELAENEAVTMDDFYDELLGKRYVPADSYEHVVFGLDYVVQSFRPTFSGGIDKNLDLRYEITYEYSER